MAHANEAPQGPDSRAAGVDYVADLSRHHVTLLIGHRVLHKGLITRITTECSL